MKINLFTLLRLGLGNNILENEDISGLLVFSSQQWDDLQKMARIQGVSAIILDGLDQLKIDGKPLRIGLTLEQKKKWIVEVLQDYEIVNQHQLQVINDLNEKWSEAGLRMMLMKGQAMGMFYPEPKHRCSGDIDCYLFENYDKGNEVAKLFADNVDEGWYKHSVIRYKGEVIENHQYFVHTREGKTSKQLNQELVNMLKDTTLDSMPGSGALLPPPMFNAVFLTYHALAHFLEEGLRLKQIIDWAMFLKCDAEKVDWKEFYKICDKYHLRRFADVMTDIAVHYLRVKLDNVEIETDSSFTEKVI